MSYSHSEFFPGKKFNVIIGPNGSGKSSIVTAITIGLGGDLSTLKRQKEYKDLVKNTTSEEDKAVICIKLFQGENDNEDKPKFDEVECQISHVCRYPEYYINGKRVDKDGMKKFAEHYQIQTSNLCQFLPQDVVRDFPQMKPGQIFHNTLNAVGKLDMIKLKQKLNHKQSQMKEHQDVLQTIDIITLS